MDFLLSLVQRVQESGAWGPVLMIGIYILACVLAVPASVLTLAAGFLFGVWKGYWVVAAGSLLGASAAFGIGRTVGRNWVRRRVESHPKFAAIDRAVSKSGFKIVMLTRLSPVFPFNLQNFAYGVTGVKFWDYVGASFIGMLPGTVMLVYVGSALQSLTEVFSGTARVEGAQRAILGIFGLLATFAITAILARIAGRALKETVEK